MGRSWWTRILLPPGPTAFQRPDGSGTLPEQRIFYSLSPHRLPRGLPVRRRVWTGQSLPPSFATALTSDGVSQCDGFCCTPTFLFCKIWGKMLCAFYDLWKYLWGSLKEEKGVLFYNGRNYTMPLGFMIITKLTPETNDSFLLVIGAIMSGLHFVFQIFS